MTVYVATKNLGKLRELQDLTRDVGWDLAVYPTYRDVAEGDASYADNAALKARALREQLVADGIEAAVIGDDSGLEVAALGGRPGVLSARYGGAEATWAERRAALLAELAATGSSDRSARFVCALHFIEVDGRERAVECDLPGAIAPVERGEGGFSYDAIFVYGPSGRTFGELSEALKNAVSHRARAVRALVEAVRTAGGKQVGAGM
jgi:XTP/dITP diphosphohydrolase